MLFGPRLQLIIYIETHSKLCVGCFLLMSTCAVREPPEVAGVRVAALVVGALRKVSSSGLGVLT